MTADPYRYFRVEAREILDQLGSGLLELERPHPPEAVARLLRLAHTLKGAARVVRQKEIADLAHALEDALSVHAGSGRPVARIEIDAMLALCDATGARVTALDAPARPADAPSSASRPEAPPTVRAEVAEVEAVLAGLAEVHAQVGALSRVQDSIARARHLADLVDAALDAPSRDGSVGPAIDRTRGLAGQLRDVLRDGERGLTDALRWVERELVAAREAAERLRLVGVAALFPGLERAARDLAHAQHKRIVVSTSGADVRLDAHVLEAVQPALMQMVRNAVTHGIESEVERRASGKPAEGRVALAVERRGRDVVFACTDDGRGVDVEGVRAAMRRRGIAAEGSTADVLARLLEARITTETTVTEASGRGVGLDVVHEAAARLRGGARIRSEGGTGTRVEIAVPFTVAALPAVLVASGGETCAIPVDGVRRAIRSRSDDARLAAGTLPCVALRALVGAPAARTGAYVVVAGPDGEAAVGVDGIVGTGQVVVRPLPDLAPAAPFVAGTWIDAEGLPRLVLDPEGLVAAARGAGPEPVDAPPVARPILVIDDSMTTRMLEQSILESAGYEVHVAVSGEEALTKAATTRYALFLVDVEMPGMDGFAFVERTRADPALRDVPAIIVSSRNAPDDLARGRAVGAVGYVVKSDFDQGDLLGRIRTLVGAR